MVVKTRGLSSMIMLDLDQVQRLLGEVHIGNHVFIAPNAVVTKDVFDNAIVGVVPTKILKIKE